MMSNAAQETLICGSMSCESKLDIHKLLATVPENPEEIQDGQWGSKLFSILKNSPSGEVRLMLLPGMHIDGIPVKFKMLVAISKIIIFVFESSDRASFEMIKTAINDEDGISLTTKKTHCECLLIGNKNDAKGRQVSVEEAEAFAVSNDMFFMDASCKELPREVLVAKLEEMVLKMRFK